MGKPTLAVHFSAAAPTALAATSASAMPIAPSAAPTPNVEQVRWVCNEWGRCWRQPDYYRPYGYYRRYDDDDARPLSLSIRLRLLWSTLLGRLRRLASRLGGRQRAMSRQYEAAGLQERGRERVQVRPSPVASKKDLEAWPMNMFRT